MGYILISGVYRIGYILGYIIVLGLYNLPSFPGHSGKLIKGVVGLRGFRVKGLRFGVNGLGIRVKGLGLWV